MAYTESEIEYIMRNNEFIDFEVAYYRGESRKVPGGATREIWCKVADRI